MKAIGSQGKASRSYDFDLEESAKYVDRDLVAFWTKEQGNQGWNYYEDSYRYRIKEWNGDWRCRDDYKEKDGVYIPLCSRDTELRIKAMLSKLV